MTEGDLEKFAAELRGRGLDASVDKEMGSHGHVPGLRLDRSFYPLWELKRAENQHDLFELNFAAIKSRRPANFEIAEPHFRSRPAEPRAELMADRSNVHTLIEDCEAEKVSRDYRRGIPMRLAKGTRLSVVDGAKVIAGHGLVRKFYTLRVGSGEFLVEEAALDSKLGKGE